jgi:hypothetical protein
MSRTVDESGIFTSMMLADALGIEERNGRSPRARVATRLSWMRRLGQIEKVDAKALELPGNDTYWLITPFGEEILKGEVSATVKSAIAKAKAGGRIAMMREISFGYARDREEVANAMRREWLHNAAQRR